MVGEGQSICDTGSIGIDIQFHRSSLQGLAGYRDAIGVLDSCNPSGSRENVYQSQGSQEIRMG